jgi:hexosaminidase
MNCYTQDAQTQSDLKAAGQTLEQALNVFAQKTHAPLLSQGKSPVVWEGTLRLWYTASAQIYQTELDRDGSSS